MDGTLARAGSPIDPTILAALRDVADRGIQVVIATGRGWLTMRETARLLPKSAYLVLNN
ncbi:MAG: HAD hydrolase family protein, partial [Chloroflexi bacterium]|nr:HAD hydrolase family protein [Chloroflexota bacterium]